jgi:transcriptional regulator with XRE-family HTH domain
MVIGERLKAIRIHKGMSQGDVEQRSGLVRAYVSRVENGHLTPTLDTLEKFGRALRVPVYQLFYEDEKLFRATTVKRDTRRVTKKEMRLMTHLRRALSRVSPADRQLLLRVALKMEQSA